MTAEHSHQALDDQTRRLVGALRGRVLEIGAGYGENFDILPGDIDYIGLEPNPKRLDELAYEAERNGHPTPPLAAQAENIPLPDASVDAVLGTMVLCSVRDTERVLAEVARVLKPGGSYVFVEHVGAPRGSWRRAAQRIAAPFMRLAAGGCDPVRDTESRIRASQLEVTEMEHYDLPGALGVSVPFVAGVVTKPREQ
ncbi:ubiquinone/menaquinone biosynthesis C-methylase UbiE [Okibacterium sp. HSC-33S16]|uniref:class I SAM-dependent methyltransferase n=1 Tax=Okibacterium sp. HSC-33S16 TaxID=2910965 RepID=UPI00209D2969|nr:class I SAM-dependent methyltransferase [Okibacterium sp. HSC-33S16]MCP2031224.1 ubiquinone/menaquinone biosynthesis C-methylase UbiE [Okibacterium sp. HSC-33S16]